MSDRLNKLLSPGLRYNRGREVALEERLRALGYIPAPRTLWDHLRRRRRWRYLPTAAQFTREHGFTPAPGQAIPLTGLFYKPDQYTFTQKGWR